MKQNSEVKSPQIEVEVDGVSYRLNSGDTLQELAADIELNIVFGCFSGRCGFCKVQVLRGVENLNSLTSLEEKFFEDVPGSSSERLACQCAPRGFVAFSTK